MSGNAEESDITWGPAPGILKMMLSVTGVALAEVMAARNEPGPASLLLVTTSSDACPEKTTVNIINERNKFLFKVDL
jgi:hypothetical protein